MANIDEVALNVLLAEGIDAPTAYAAAQEDRPQEPRRPPANVAAQIGGLIGGLAFIVYWFFMR
jgi:hypothetical protein